MKRIVLGAVLVVILIAIVANGGFQERGAARATLEKAGFKDIEITGWDPFSCAEDDLTSTGFVATNANGIRSNGVVCCGLLKGCTIRF